MQDLPHSIRSADLLAPRATWPDMWRKYGDAWPVSARFVFPHVHSGTDEWVQISQREPRVLLSLLQIFSYPEEILHAIDDQAVKSCTSVWIRSCVQVSLVSYLSWPTHPATRQWLDAWGFKFTRPAPYTLPDLTDSHDDWVRPPPANDYVNDPILKQ